VPLEITFYNNKNEKTVRTITVSGQFSTANVQLPFKPVYWTINENQKLNNGQFNDRLVLPPNSKKSAPYANIGFKSSNEETDTVNIYAEHVFGAPDSVKNNSIWSNLNISKTHFWNIIGDFPEDNNIEASFFYNGKHDSDLDYLLTNRTEDSIQIVYRKDASDDWTLFENFKKQKFSPKDGKGNIKIHGVKAGQYCFANVALATKTSEISGLNNIYPNPASDFINIANDENKIEEISLFNIFGNTIYMDNSIGAGDIRINVKSYIPGIYFVKTKDLEGKIKINKLMLE